MAFPFFAIDNGTLAVSLTRFTPFGNAEVAYDATEANNKLRYRTAGTFSLFYCKINTNGITASSTVTLRKNGANGNSTVSIPSSTTGAFNDLTHTDTIAAGDDVNLQVVTGATGTTLGPWAYGALFQGTTTGMMKSCMNASSGTATASTSYFRPMAGFFTFTGNITEAIWQHRNKAAGTYQNMNIFVSANARGTATTLTFRKNTANGNQTLSIGAGLTGVFEDTTHTDAVVANDLICTDFVTGTGAGTITVYSISNEFVTTNSSADFYSSGGTDNPGVNITRYNPWQGAETALATEADAQVKAILGGSLSNFNVSVHSNGITAATTLRFRKNTANGNEVISIGSGLTGTFEDTTNTDTVAAADLVNYQYVTGGTGTTITMDNWGIMFTNPTIPLPVFPNPVDTMSIVTTF